MKMAGAAAGGSLRRRVLTLAISAVALVWLCAAVYSYVDARHETNEVLDGYLAQSAAMIAAQASEEFDEFDVEHAPQLHKYARRVAFQILGPRSRAPPSLRQRAEPAPDGARRGLRGRCDRRPPLAGVLELGPQAQIPDSGRGGARRARCHCRVGRSQPVDAAPPRAARPCRAAVVGRRGGAAALRTLGDQVARRAPDNLAQLDAGTPPAEVAPLVSSLNHLFERVTESIARERQFTADAAHELRTPIAALRTQAQVALGATTDAERSKALRQVMAGCDRAARLVDQMLTLARLDPMRSDRPSEPCDLAAIAKAALADVAPAAMSKSVDVEFATGERRSLPVMPSCWRFSRGIWSITRYVTAQRAPA